MSPPPLPPAAPGEGSGTPWESRAPGEFVGPLVQTTTGVLLEPAEFFRRMPVTGGIGAPFGYAVVIGYAGLLAQAIYQAIFRIGFGSVLAGLGRRGEIGQLLALLQGGVGLMVQVIMGPIIVTMGLFLAAGLYHVVLWLLGSARRDFEATFRVAAYGHAVSALLVLPVCGSVIAMMWWLVVLTIGFAEAHGISRGQSLVAVLLPLVLACCCCGVFAGLVGLGLGGIASLVHLAR
ncbi:MAG: YIP1 family protein [Vicinamibacteria bacterium]